MGGLAEEVRRPIAGRMPRRTPGRRPRSYDLVRGEGGETGRVLAGRAQEVPEARLLEMLGPDAERARALVDAAALMLERQAWRGVPLEHLGDPRSTMERVKRRYPGPRRAGLEALLLDSRLGLRGACGVDPAAPAGTATLPACLDQDASRVVMIEWVDGAPGERGARALRRIDAEAEALGLISVRLLDWIRIGPGGMLSFEKRCAMASARAEDDAEEETRDEWPDGIADGRSGRRSA